MTRAWLMVAALAAVPAFAQGVPAKKPARRTAVTLSAVQDQLPFTPEELDERRKDAGDDAEAIATDKELNGWKLCVLDSVNRWAALKEGPGTVADAAFGRCIDNERRYRDHLLKLSQDGHTTVDPQMAKGMLRALEDTWRLRIAAAVLDQRLAPPAPAPDPLVKP